MPLKVKVGDKIYDSDEEPILLIFKDIHKVEHRTHSDKKMNTIKYCAYPAYMEDASVERYMEIDNDGSKT